MYVSNYRIFDKYHKKVASFGAGTMSGTMYRWSLSWSSPFSFCRRPGPRVLGTGCPTGSSAFHIFPQVGIRVFSRQLLNYQSVRIRNGRLSQPSPMVSYGGHSFDREYHDLGVVCGVRRAQLPTHSTRQLGNWDNRDFYFVPNTLWSRHLRRRPGGQAFCDFLPTHGESAGVAWEKTMKVGRSIRSILMQELFRGCWISTRTPHRPRAGGSSDWPAKHPSPASACSPPTPRRWKQ